MKQESARKTADTEERLMADVFCLENKIRKNDGRDYVI
jgi:hypothetical protein